MTAEVLLGDCLDVLPRLRAGSVDLVYMDPPYGKQQAYSGPAGEFYDTWPTSPRSEEWAATAHSPAMGAYVGEMRARLVECRRALADTGSLWLHCNPTAAGYLRVVLDEVMGADNFRNEVIWCFRFGTSGKGQFRRKHHNLFWYSKSGEWCFNGEVASVPSRSAWAAQNGISEVVDVDWWEVPAVNNRERNGYPTQKPVELLERIIAATSRPGDLVLDPFCGSGTTLAAAVRLGRRAVGVDVNRRAVALCRERLSAVQVRL